MAATLPMRFRILHLISENEGISEEELLEALKPEYGAERQYKRSAVRDHLASMRAVGMIEITLVDVDKDGNLLQRVRITDYGKSRLKYLPYMPRPGIVLGDGAKIPMRFRILHIISQHTDISDDEIMEALAPEYGNEGQFRKSVIADHLASMKAVGMIETTSVLIDGEGNLVRRVRNTDYGRSRLAYLPKVWAESLA